jgi:NADPH:quinone reductase-like Zn-dependent oxidoreductase
MRAVRIHRYGGPEVLMVEEAPMPEPGRGEVLVRVVASSVNPVDWKIREGKLDAMFHYKFPLVLGWDVSGIVEKLGPETTGFAPGAAVFSRPDIARDGAYAEFVVVRASELAHKPASLGHVEAASVPLVALTAWQTLFEASPPHVAAGLSAGQTVLVHAASGGVGSFAVQLAKWRGAKVIATASGKNEAFVRGLGADVFVDYTKQRFEDVAKDVDVVLDGVGGETQERSFATLRPGGILVSIAGRPSADLAKKHGVRVGYVFVQPNAAQLTKIAALLDEKVLKTEVQEVLPLAEARRAQEISATGRVRGKIVLKV